MIVQIDNTAIKTLDSGHVFKDDCPDRANLSYYTDRNTCIIGTAIRSGHLVINVDIVSASHIFGHLSGHAVVDIDKNEDPVMNQDIKDMLKDKLANILIKCNDLKKWTI